MRLIDAESLVIAMSKRESTNCSTMYHRGYEDMLAAVAEATTINAKPVVHSRLNHFRAYHQCDNCGQHFQIRMGQGNPLRWKGCPYCLAVWDADMRKENL